MPNRAVSGNVQSFKLVGLPEIKSDGFAVPVACGCGDVNCKEKDSLVGCKELFFRVAVALGASRKNAEKFFRNKKDVTAKLAIERVFREAMEQGVTVKAVLFRVDHRGNKVDDRKNPGDLEPAVTIVTTKEKLKKLRASFNAKCMSRDHKTCRVCGSRAVDVHHITDRHEMPNGGYAVENGISLCAMCHKLAEKFHQTGGKDWEKGFHPNDLYERIGSSKKMAQKACAAL